MKWTSSDQVVLNHYEQRWGKPKRIHAFDRAQVPDTVRPLYVGEFHLSEDQLQIYASIGMSRVPMYLPSTDSNHRVEIFLGTFRRFAKLPELIARLASYPHIDQSFVGAEHTIPLGEKIVPKSEMEYVIFCPPYFDPPEFHVIKMETLHIQMLWVIPLHKSEKEFKVKEGWGALRKIFQEKHVAIGDFLRVPAL